jgi:hypothetical protein
MACDEMERLVNAYMARAQAFSAALKETGENFFTWCAIVEQAEREREHAYEVMKKHFLDHGCCDVLPLF